MSQLFNHGGQVLVNPTVYTIYWLPGFGTPGCATVTTSTPGCAVVSPNYQRTINQFFGDFNGSAVLNDIDAQYPGSNGVSQAVGLGGSELDTSTPYPHQGTPTDPIFQSDLRNEIDRARAAHSSWGSDTGAMY